MKLNNTIMTGALLGYVGALFAVAGLENGMREAVADENPPEQAVVQKEITQEKTPAQETPVHEAPSVLFPDYEIGLFSHKAHVTGAGLQCTDCHTGIFQMSAGTAKANGDFDKISFGEGKYCGACHNGSMAFGIQDEAGCKRCHGNDVNPPDTILLEKSVKAVLFNHALHNKELGLACNECHMRLFAMKTGNAGEQDDFNMEAMYNGKYCGACHNGSLAFDLKTDCTGCHIDGPDNNQATSSSGKKKSK